MSKCCNSNKCCSCNNGYYNYGYNYPANYGNYGLGYYNGLGLYNNYGLGFNNYGLGFYNNGLNNLALFSLLFFLL